MHLTSYLRITFRKRTPDKIDPPQEQFHLPNEILEIIVNELANASDSDRSLASCRLASHNFCLLVTPFFFSCLSLTESFSGASCKAKVAALKKRARKLNQILTKHDIAASVQTLKICCHRESIQNSNIGTLISKIIRRLAHVRHFILKAFNEQCYQKCLEFSRITKNFSSAIETLCRSPHLITLDIDGISHFPITPIVACPNLRCLRLTSFGFNVIPILHILW